VAKGPSWIKLVFLDPEQYPVMRGDFTTIHRWSYLLDVLQLGGIITGGYSKSIAPSLSGGVIGGLGPE
jgi:hypothetical protein